MAKQHAGGNAQELSRQLFDAYTTACPSALLFSCLFSSRITKGVARSDFVALARQARGARGKIRLSPIFFSLCRVDFY